MTPLERRWVESRWTQSTWFAETRWVHTGGFLDAVRLADGSGWCGRYYGAAYFTGPPNATLAEAKSDAEAMYRQWVYDEYGVVLP
jgi:hypothetical protein